MEFGENSSVDERSPAGARISRPTAAWHQNGVRSKHARLCTSRARYGRGSIEYRRNPVRRPRSTVDLRSNFKARNGLKWSDCRPNIDRLPPEYRSMLDRSTGDLFTSSATSKIANKKKKKKKSLKWKGPSHIQNKLFYRLGRCPSKTSDQKSPGARQ